MVGYNFEQKMFGSTGGVNTHRRLLFLLGLAAGVAGCLLGRQGNTQINDLIAHFTGAANTRGRKLIMQWARGIAPTRLTGETPLTGLIIRHLKAGRRIEN
jgi:hypothetical protein